MRFSGFQEQALGFRKNPFVASYNLTPVAMPFGGSKQSGLGRENGLAALDFYSERKSVYVNLGRVEAPY